MSPDEKTPEQIQADLNVRIQNFNAELIPLLGKYKLGLGSQAMLSPDGRIVSRPALVDDSAPKPTDAEKTEDKDGAKMESAE